MIEQANGRDDKRMAQNLLCIRPCVISPSVGGQHEFISSVTNAVLAEITWQAPPLEVMLAIDPQARLRLSSHHFPRP
ncbi:hypothetical protein AU476_06260 [Cupriavidus sp. UYMSc13B]|nr:hypothetical protein AU476_06260 [Cupriavidus sp. UYMSc13B]